MPRGVPKQKTARASEHPSLVILDENFGFMDNGCLRQWHEGQVVTQARDIALLIEHNAPLKDLGHV